MSTKTRFLNYKGNTLTCGIKFLSLVDSGHIGFVEERYNEKVKKKMAIISLHLRLS